MPTQEKNHAIDNALGHLEGIRELLSAYHAGGGTVDGEELSDADAVQERIEECPLSVMVRSGWYVPGTQEDRETAPAEFEILLTTGGPALRIIGQLGRYGEPENARLEWQDWGTPWTELHASAYPADLKPSEADDLLRDFASHFYFGEG